MIYFLIFFSFKLVRSSTFTLMCYFECNNLGLAVSLTYFVVQVRSNSFCSIASLNLSEKLSQIASSLFVILTYIASLVMHDTVLIREIRYVWKITANRNDMLLNSFCDRDNMKLQSDWRMCCSFFEDRTTNYFFWPTWLAHALKKSNCEREVLFLILRN